MRDTIDLHAGVRRPFRTRIGSGATIVALGASLLGCGEPEQEAQSPEPTPPAQELREEPVPGALYHTELTFVGRAADPSLLHLRFDHRTDSAAIHLRYRGWFGGEDWSRILDHADSLPVPRAAWRILPSGPVRVMAGEGGEPSSLVVQLPEGSLRLDSRGAIGTWASSSGQRESLRLAELLDESGAEAGLLLGRKSARHIDDQPGQGQAQYFLVSDTTGNGLLIMRDDTAPDAPVTAWTWFDDTEAEWSDVLVLTLAAPEGSPGRWSFEFPEAGLLGELQGVGPEFVEPTEEGLGVEVFRVEAALVLEGQSWTMQGIGVQELTGE